MAGNIHDKAKLTAALTAAGFARIVESVDMNGTRMTNWELWLHAGKGPLIVYAQRPVSSKDHTLLDVYRPLTPSSDIGVQLAAIRDYRGESP